MCGRFTLKAGPNVLSKQFLLKDLSDLPSRFNIAPSQKVFAVRKPPESASRSGFTPRWGLIPSWAKDEKIGYKLINARSETAPGKPSFRAAFQKRRCLVPASGFFEWKRHGTRKQPFYIYPSPVGEDALGGSCFAFAGLWETWKPYPDAPALESVTLLTTAANESIRKIHDRMPLVILQEDQDLWLDPDHALTETDWTRLAQPLPEPFSALYPVSPHVNSPRHDDPSCLEPIIPAEPFQPRQEDDRQESFF